jgi:hypothetical protein
MPEGTGLEVTTIAAAYQDHVKTLFVGLCTSLEQGRPEPQSIQQFTKGYNLAKRARELALNVVKVSPETAVAASAMFRRARTSTATVGPTTKQRGQSRRRKT